MNDEGQLGFGNRNIAWPEIVESIMDVPITEVAAGRYSSAVDHKGQLYVWGRYNGQNVLDPMIPDCLQTPIRHIYQNNSVSTCIDVNGKLYAWANLDSDSLSQNPMGLPLYPKLH